MEIAIHPLNTAAIAVVALLVLMAVKKYRGRRSHPLPPGPPGEFLLGHLRVIPFEDAPTAYLKWGVEYNSDVLYFNTLGQPIIVLNSVKAAVDLLDKRGSNYADRPRFVLLELLGWGMTLTFLRWSPKMQQHRRILQNPFTKPKVVQYKSLQIKQSHRLVQGIMQSPLDWELELKRFAIAIVANIGYGVNVDRTDHPWIKLANDAGYATAHSGAPASSIVDRFPLVQYLPDWLPGLHRLKYAHDWSWAIKNIHEKPFQAALKEMEEGVNNASFTTTLLEKYNENKKRGLPNDFTLADIKGAAGAIIIAGGDTTLTTLVVFFLMMMVNQEAQQKAQAEIEAVVGSDRLPEFDDLPNLTYLSYIIQEVYRIAPLSPLGIPHRSLEDDVYNGMFIPKEYTDFPSSMIYQNVRAMNLNPDFYSEPETFNPDRYIPAAEGGRGEPFPNGNFGFGRRICLGQNLANNSLFIAMATVLATLNIEWPLGPNGKPTPFQPEWSKIGQFHPMKFQCHITSRSKGAEELIFNSV